jgi:porin
VERTDSRKIWTYALNYYSVFLKASDSLPDTKDDAASGVVRFSGFWQLYGRGGDSNSTGTLIYLVEQRHRYTDNLPQTFALENLGSVGFIGIPYGSEGGLHPTNLYWNQEWLPDLSTLPTLSMSMPSPAHGRTFITLYSA